MTQKRNVELKARIFSASRTRARLREIGAKRVSRLRQVDTYFRVNKGRLKLRKVSARTAQLVFYQRRDLPGPKESKVMLLPVRAPKRLFEILSTALGRLTVVDKTRELYRYGGISIHVDKVRGLGDFIEFEKVIGPGRQELSSGVKILQGLMDSLDLQKKQLQLGSYCDLLLSRHGDEKTAASRV
ncbi:MAG: class IV adenylate cyclase [archaeon]